MPESYIQSALLYLSGIASHMPLSSISFIGTLPGWIMAISSSGTLGIIARIWLQSRKVTVVERQSERDGYGDIIERLSSEVAGLHAANIVRDAANQARDDKLTKFEELSLGLKVRVGQLESALRIAIEELAETSPNSPALRLIHNIMSSLYPVSGLDSPDLQDVADRLRKIT